MENRIAQFFDFPAEITDGRWHIVTLAGQEFEYRAAHGGYGEGLYRHRSAFGSSNACFSLSGDPENFAAKVGRYIAGASHRSGQTAMDDETAATLGASAKLGPHRPK